MKRIELLCLLGLAWGLSSYLQNTKTGEGLSELEEADTKVLKKKDPEDSKDKKTKDSKDKKVQSFYVEDANDELPDHYVDKDNRNVHGLISLQDKAAVLHSMTPQFIHNRLNESSYKYRWIADEWPKCTEKCSSKPIQRKVGCFGRNEKPYADDMTMKSLYSKDFSEKDEFGKTKCDYQNSGISINVKPSEQTFCSLINNCSYNTLSETMAIDSVKVYNKDDNDKKDSEKK